MLRTEDRRIIANTSNISGLYYLSKGIRLNQLDYACKIIKEYYYKDVEYPTQLSILEDINPERSNQPVILSNILYSGITTLCSNIIVGSDNSITPYDIIRSSIYECDKVSTAPKALSPYNALLSISEESCKYIYKSMLVDSYVNLLRYRKYVYKISLLTGVKEKALVNCITEEIQKYSKIISLPNTNVIPIETVFISFQPEKYENNVSTLLKENKIKVNEEVINNLYSKSGIVKQ